ncbi:hypothetical protein Tco_0667187 [Tanacetum coccineum]
MLLVKKDEAGITLIKEENEFLLANVNGEEELEELNASCIMKARIQTIDNNSDLEPSYDFDFANEVHNSTSSFVNDIFSKNDHKQRYQAQPKSIKPTYDDDKMDSDIIFYDLNVEIDSESVVQDTSAHDQKYVEFESLMRNVQLKADKTKRDNVLLKKRT